MIAERMIMIITGVVEIRLSGWNISTFWSLAGMTEVKG
jgi:hypothetical protein